MVGMISMMPMFTQAGVPRREYEGWLGKSRPGDKPLRLMLPSRAAAQTALTQLQKGHAGGEQAAPAVTC